MKKILLPTDFSEYALNGIFTAIKLHNKTASKFIILHTYLPDTRNIASRQNASRAGLVFEAMHQNALIKLEETLQAIAKVYNDPKHEFSVQAVQGNLETVIKELVPKYDLDLIVMGTKGATGAKEIFLGSNAVQVLKKVRNCPILIVPIRFNFQTLQRIVFPNEYVNFFSKAQLRILVALAEVWRSQILVFHVAQEFKLSTQQLENKEILKKRLGTINHSYYKVPIETTVAKAITEFATEQLADMICLVHYSHTFLEKLTQEPVVKKVGFHTEVPLLVLPE